MKKISRRETLRLLALAATACLTACRGIGNSSPYPEDYEETVQRNVREQEADARPAIANPLASIEPYDTLLLGSPIWNVRAPMIMSSFVEGFDFAGKTVFP